MPERKPDGHKWIGAATVVLPHTVVRQAAKRGTFIVRRDMKVAIEEVYCSACRKTYGRAAGKPCEAIESRRHLRGGPIDDQRKRSEAASEDEDEAELPAAAFG